MGKSLPFRFYHIFIFLLLTPPLSSAPKDTFYQRFLSHRAAISSCGFRLEGSPAETRAFSYLRDTLKKQNLSMEELDFSAMRDGHSFSRILSVTLPGAAPNLLILAIPLSQEESLSSGEETEPDGIALALSLIEEWGHTPPPASLRILFLGGDTGRGEGIGSRFYLQHFQTTSPTLMLYLHLPRIPSLLEIQTGTRGLSSPALPLRLFLHAFDSKGIELLLRGSQNQLYRMGVPVSPTPLGPFLRAQIAALGIRGNPYTHANPPATKDWIEAFQEGFQSFLSQYGALDLSSSPLEWDTHYILFHWGQKFLLLDEMSMVGTLLGVLTVSFILAFLRRKQTLRYLSTLFRNFWNLPFFFLLLFLFLSIGTWTLRVIEQIRFPLWEYAPLLHFLLKLSTATFLFSLFFHTLHKLPLARRGSFYSASSILFFFVNILVFSLIDIALCYYFLWGFLCSWGFSFFKRKRMKLLFLLIAPLLLYLISYDLFSAPELPMIRVLLTSSTGNFLLAFMLLPFLLMLIRIDFLLRHPASHKPGWGVKSIILLSGALTLGLLGYLLSFSPFHDRPIPVFWREVADFESGTHSLALSCVTYLQEGSFPYRTSRIEIPPRSRKVETSLPMVEDPIQLQVRETSFLNRTTYHLTVTSTVPATLIECSIEAPEDTVIYGSNFPLARTVGTRFSSIFIGKNPPQPLSLVLTLPEKISFTLHLTLHSRPRGLPALGEGYQLVNPEYTIKKRVRIERG
jgi:hypothetical protein